MIKIDCIEKEFHKVNISIHKFNHANVILLIVAAIIASVGILTNNYQTVIASKVIGLALTPFLSLSIVLLALSTGQIIRSTFNCVGLILLCISVGFLIGIINAYNNYVMEPTPEMKNRGEFKYENIKLEMFIAFVVGIGIYYAMIKTSLVAYVGLIIVVSVIPALSNAGVCYGMAIANKYNISNNTTTPPTQNTNNLINNNLINNKNENKEKYDMYLDYGNRSFILFLVNIIGVFIGFSLMFLVNCI